MEDQLQRYAQNQRNQYDTTSRTLEEAQAQIAPNYLEVRRIAGRYARFMLQQYAIRRGGTTELSAEDLSRLRILDFGCGVGRVMEAFTELGIGQVDGCDISEAMLTHARASPSLQKSEFFLTNGQDAGAAPEGQYDIAYAFLCLHHIPMRETRIAILRSLAKVLAPDGMIFIELKIFPGATPAKIPPQHAHWSENMVATYTNSASDVWVTPDALGMVYGDFRLFFFDIALIEFDLGTNHFEFNPSSIYRLGFNELFVVGSRKPTLKKLAISQ